MNTRNKKIVEEIIKAARSDERKRKDPRYLRTMGFLVSKGFLKTNQAIILMPNARLHIKDTMWAGINVEPRILEVLPAVVLRFPRHFDFAREQNKKLAEIIACLKRGSENGPSFHEIPYEKLKVWTDLKLRDGRVKGMSEKKITRTFRLRPSTVQVISKLSKQHHLSQAEVLERLVADTL
ncbi:MAG: hypothetical protein HY537_00240 [Deltaproteobacteria bacterium]|nr:hypothetical protein [Deltaproteobacteria bacterium]